MKRVSYILMISNYQFLGIVCTLPCEVWGWAKTHHTMCPPEPPSSLAPRRSQKPEVYTTILLQVWMEEEV